MKRGTLAVINRGWLSDGLVGWLYAQPEDLHLVRPVGREIAAQRNRAVEEMQGDWLLFVDSDCIPPPRARLDLLLRGLPLVGGVILERSSEFEVCAVKTFEPTERYRLEELPSQGIMPVLSLGTGCLLIRREVLEAIGSPWFRVGQLVSDCLTEDTDFCLRAAERGFPAFLDCGVRVGHEVSGVLWPHEEGSKAIQWEGAPYRQALEVPSEVEARECARK